MQTHKSMIQDKNTLIHYSQTCWTPTAGGCICISDARVTSMCVSILITEVLGFDFFNLSSFLSSVNQKKTKKECWVHLLLWKSKGLRGEVKIVHMKTPSSTLVSFWALNIFVSKTLSVRFVFRWYIWSHKDNPQKHDLATSSHCTTKASDQTLTVWPKALSGSAPVLYGSF